MSSSDDGDDFQIIYSESEPEWDAPPKKTVAAKGKGKATATAAKPKAKDGSKVISRLSC
jgi:hypothetical protein